MPKIVDHDERRLELVDATWRIIARLGIEGATMREIATEAGFANGALKPYFPTKDTLLTFAFGHVFNRTNERIRRSDRGQGRDRRPCGRFASRCCRWTRSASTRRGSSIPFWQKAINDPGEGRHPPRVHGAVARVHPAATSPRPGKAAPSATAVDDSAVAGHLLNMLLGAQIAAALAPEGQADPGLGDQLDAFLTLLACR